MDPVLASSMTFVGCVLTALAVLLLLLALLPIVLGVRYIPHNRVGLVEKSWSGHGSVPDGRLIALCGEAGYQADVLRGGLHFFYWPWQYRIHHVPLTVVSQGKIGYVFARDGEPLPPTQTLGQVVPCNDFQDTRAFLSRKGGVCPGQRGRQRAIIREGVYAINLAQFVVITEEVVYRLDMHRHREAEAFEKWRLELAETDGFDPVVVGRRRQVSGEVGVAFVEGGSSDKSNDNIAIVTVHDGPSLIPGTIIAPPIATDPQDEDYHNNYQDTEAFLRAGGRRGRQYVPLTDGTYFINRWFATVELIPKTVVPIGHVGVVVSYYGKKGTDVSGETFRHGERVAEGTRGVLTTTLGPGKYAFNAYAGRVHLVPTTNFVLHWITGRTEQHRYDESLKSIDLVTADAYEPVLPLSVVIHIDYQKAPSVVQRFADIKKLITQTLDPMLSAYFRDIAHKKTMLELLHDRDVIQDEARVELKSRFAEFDIELVDVLIGKPETVESSGEIELLLEQLRQRQLSKEQIETYQRQSDAAQQLQQLKIAQARAEKQTELTQSQMDVEIAANRGDADLALARKNADQVVVMAEAENKKKLLLAEADAKSHKLMGDAESHRTTAIGSAEAEVLREKIVSFGDPRLYAVSLVARHLADSRQPLVPANLFTTGSNGNGNLHDVSGGPLSTLVELLVAERLGFDPRGEKPSGTPPAKRPTADEPKPPAAQTTSG